MPTYGYVCDNCGQELEAFQKMSDAPLRTCPACGKDRLRRQIFATGIVFKGSGFYKTDYASQKKGSEASPAGGGSTEKKADSAPKVESTSTDKPSSSTD